MSATQQTLAQMIRAKHPGSYDDMDDATLEKNVLAKYPQYSDLPQTGKQAPTRSWDDPGTFLGNLIRASGTQGLVELAKNPPKNFTDMLSMGLGPAKQVGKAVAAPAQILNDMVSAHQAGDHKQVLDHIGKLADSFIPGTQNAYELSKQTLDDLQQGNYAGMAGTAGGLGLQLAMARNATKSVAPGATNPLSERLYQSALKPGPGSYSTEQVASMVKTGLENKIPVSASGVEKLGSLVDDLNSKIKAQIDAGTAQGATVNKYAVTSRLAGTARKFATQVNPESDLSAIGESGNEFLRSQPTEIPVSQAQAMKQGTYQQLKGRAYGELKSATVESQKSLARGLKEEIATAFPEIADMNAKESQLINLDGALERAVRRIDNHQMLGIGTPIAAGAAGAITKSTGIGAAVGVLKAVIDDPFLKSKLAIALNRKGIPLGTANARIASYAASLANTSTPSSATNENQP